jgi:hypothetical protein
MMLCALATPMTTTRTFCPGGVADGAGGETMRPSSNCAPPGRSRAGKAWRADGCVCSSCARPSARPWPTRNGGRHGPLNGD